MDKKREAFEKEIKEWYPLAECIAKERNISICDLYPIEWSLWQASSIPEGYVLVSKEPSLKVLDRLFAEHDLDEDRASYIYRDVIDAQESNRNGN